jgi:hypothetical protein
VRRTVPPSAEIEEQIDQLLAVGVGENPRESLSELAKLGARLIIQRAVLYDGGIVPDPEGIITAGHDNKTARTVAFREGETINEPALLAMFRQIVANNRAGGWRKIKAGSGDR